MARKFVLAIGLAFLGLLLPFLPPSGFTFVIVDDQTGNAVPGLRVTDENGMVRRTGSHGELIIWHRTPATKGGDRFQVDDERDRYEAAAATLKVTAGGHATVRVHRRS